MNIRKDTITKAENIRKRWGFSRTKMGIVGAKDGNFLSKMESGVKIGIDRIQHFRDLCQDLVLLADKYDIPQDTTTEDNTQ